MIKMIVNEEMLRPVVGTEGSAGYDLKLASDIQIRPGQVVKVGTGVKVAIPKGYWGMVAPRSSVDGIELHNTIGVIDSDYQGEIMLLLYNKTNQTKVYYKGDRLVQLVLVPVLHEEIEYVDSFDTVTERGSKGFGSTGKSDKVEKL